MIQYPYDTILKYRKMILDAVRNIENNERNANLKCKCKAGCDKCCSDLILVCPDEAVMVVQELITMPDSQVERIRKRTLEQAGILESNGITIKNVKEIVDRGNPGEIIELKDKYYNLQLPCVFLEDHKCSIYSVRPTDCWTYRQYISSENCVKGPAREGCYCYKEYENQFIFCLNHSMHPGYEFISNMFAPLPLLVKKYMMWNEE